MGQPLVSHADIKSRSTSQSHFQKLYHILPHAHTQTILPLSALTIPSPPHTPLFYLNMSTGPGVAIPKAGGSFKVRLPPCRTHSVSTSDTQYADHGHRRRLLRHRARHVLLHALRRAQQGRPDLYVAFHLQMYVADFTFMVGITRHGQQPGNTHMPGMTGARLCTTNRVAEPANALAAIPLPGNDDNRGSDTFVGRLMSVVVVRTRVVRLRLLRLTSGLGLARRDAAWRRTGRCRSTPRTNPCRCSSGRMRLARISIRRCVVCLWLDAGGCLFRYAQNLPFDLEAWKKRREETNEARIKPVQA